MKRQWLVLLVAVALPALACEGGQEAGAEGAPAGESAAEVGAEQEAAMPAPAQQMALPDTTAQGVWSYLQDVDYESWQLWPGKGELYEGTEPHGMLLTTYLNDTAYEALTTGSGPLPAGSIVIKENYAPDSTLVAVTVMYAAEGYDAEHNDWFWAKYQTDGSVDAAGRVESCQTCHASGERGFLRTPVETEM